MIRRIFPLIPFNSKRPHTFSQIKTTLTWTIQTHGQSMFVVGQAIDLREECDIKQLQ